MSLCEYGCNQESKYEMSNGKKCCSDNWRRCPAVREKNSTGLRLAHIEGRLKCGFRGNEGWSKGKSAITDSRVKSKYSDPEILFSKNTVPIEYIKKALIELKILEYKCNRCGISDWNGERLGLELDHMDGDRFNNEKSNLRFLCPNCHSQTPNFRGRNINKGKQISDELLIDALNKTTNIRQALILCGLAPKGGNYIRAKRLHARMAEWQTQRT